MTKKKKHPSPPSFLNKKASFSYTLLDRYTAGIKLLGTEIKSIRHGRINLTDAYAYFDPKGALWAKGIHISPYQPAALQNHDPNRRRKLLLTKRELRKVHKQQQEKGNTIVVVRLFINEKGLAKLEIATAKGKKLHDKRETIKERDLERNIKKEYA